MKSTKKEKKQYKKAFQEAMARELREHKSSFIVFSILRILVLVVLGREIAGQHMLSSLFRKRKQG